MESKVAKVLKAYQALLESEARMVSQVLREWKDLQAQRVIEEILVETERPDLRGKQGRQEVLESLVQAGVLDLKAIPELLALPDEMVVTLPSPPTTSSP